MNENEFFYIAPETHIFEDVKMAAVRICKKYYDNDYGYVDEKVNRINKIMNIRDNACYIMAMFDMNNKQRLRQELQFEESRVWFDKVMDIYNKTMAGMMKEARVEPEDQPKEN